MDRKAIAGIIGKKEKAGTQLESYDWGWFGSMVGAGVFRNRISENDDDLSLALDHIPTTGDVSEDDYNAFINCFQKAFKK